MSQTRRGFIALGSALAAAQAQAQRAPRPEMWKPKVGGLVNYSEANVAFMKQEGFTSIGFWAQPKSNLAPDTATDASLAKIKEDVRQSGLHCSVIGVTVNHIDPDPAKRKAVNDHVAGVIEIAGKLGVAHLGTMSGKDPAKKLDAQVDEIRRVYEEKYFPLCEKHKVRLIWEPWPEGPNVATGPMPDKIMEAFTNASTHGSFSNQ